MNVEVDQIILMIIFLVFSYFWIFLVIWVYIDAKRKERNAKICSTFTFLLGPLGLLIYYSLGEKLLLTQKFMKLKDIATIFPHLKKDEQERIIEKTIDQLITDAINSRATDIHLTSSQDEITVKFRTDGYLHEYLKLPLSMGVATISAIKVLSNLDIAQKRTHQDGSFTKDLKNRKIDLRVAVSGSHYGETMAIRVLDPQQGLVDIKDLGLLPEVEDKFRSLIYRKDGMVLITGPTGCGKTTTLYAILNKINHLGKNIISIEDPIEYNIANITQIQINPRAGITFANSLRSILRQDPDIIMIGEIRDVETGKMAIEASLTGHLVFSTLHTKSSVETVVRLLEMGFEPYLISSSTVGVVSQRLVRLICPLCRIPYPLETDECLGEESIPLRRGETVYKGKGCTYCNNTGYRRRTGLFEVLIIDKK